MHYSCKMSRSSMLFQASAAISSGVNAAGRNAVVTSRRGDVTDDATPW